MKTILLAIVLSIAVAPLMHSQDAGSGSGKTTKSPKKKKDSTQKKG